MPHTYNYNWFSISFFYRLHRNKRRKRSFILRKTFSISQLFKKKIIRRTITYLLCSIIILNIHFTNYIDRDRGSGTRTRQWWVQVRDAMRDRNANKLNHNETID